MKNRLLSSPRKNPLPATTMGCVLVALFSSGSPAFASSTTATYSGTITETTEAFTALTPAGTQMNGSIQIDTAELEKGQVTGQGLMGIAINIGGICLNTGTSGCSGGLSLAVTSIDSVNLIGTGGELDGQLSLTSFISTFQTEVTVVFNFTDKTVNFDSPILGSMVGEGALEAPCIAPACIDTDVDDDSIENSVDNCILASNQEQTDSDQDGFGNACDPDLDNNDVVNFVDLTLWTPFFNTSSSGDPDFDNADFNSDGFVNFSDFVLFQSYFLLPPGPSALSQ